MPLDPEVWPIFASAGGSLTTVILDAQSTMQRKVGEWFVGALAGYLLGPAIADHLGNLGPNDRVAAVYLTAVLGMFLISGLLDQARNAGITGILATIGRYFPTAVPVPRMSAADTDSILKAETDKKPFQKP